MRSVYRTFNAHDDIWATADALHASKVITHHSRTGRYAVKFIIG